MKKTLHQMMHNLTFNLKTLLLFVGLYRIIGLLVIFPLTRLLFLYSIRLTGISYINNRLLLDYLLTPSTVLILILLLFIYTVYFAIELIYLALLFDISRHEEKIGFLLFLQYGLKKIWPVFKQYHFFLILPTMTFILIVELGHIVGIASTIAIPSFVLSQIQLLPYTNYIIIGILLIAFAYLMESSFHMHAYIIEGLQIQSIRKKSRQSLKGKRIKHITEFIALNLLLNGVLYGIYSLVILIIGALVFLTRGQEFVLGFLLTFLYTIYSIFIFISSLILVPINFALFSSWYDEGKTLLGEKINWLKFAKIIRQPFESKRMKRGLILTLIVVFMLNITAIFSAVTQPLGQLEIFNYAQIVSHRGASKEAPENTLASIELAINQGADAIEFDVRLTRDLVPVLMHDTTLRRTTGDPRRVDQVTYDELMTLEAGAWFHEDFRGEKIPTLDEALELIAGRAIAFIELKVNNIVLERITIDLVEAYQMTQHVVILSFYRDQLGRIKQLNPEVQTLLLMTSFIGNEDAVISYPEVDIFGFERSFILSRPDLIDRIHRRGKKVYVWTLSTEAHIRDATQYDFDGLITSLPIQAREIEYSKNRQVEFIELLRSLFRPRNTT